MALTDLFSRPHAGHAASAPRPTLRQRLAVWKSRRDLAQLDRAALKDVGLTLREAREEAARTLWDVPASWTNR